MKDLYSIMGDVDDTEEAARERARIREGRDRAEALEFAHRQAVVCLHLAIEANSYTGEGYAPTNCLPTRPPGRKKPKPPTRAPTTRAAATRTMTTRATARRSRPARYVTGIRLVEWNQSCLLVRFPWMMDGAIPSMGHGSVAIYP